MCNSRSQVLLFLSVLAVIRQIAGSVFAEEPARNDGLSWPTLHGEVRRAGFYPQFPEGELKLVWRKQLHEELTGPRAEVIVAEGLAVMGTYQGNFYAWDAATGEERWVFRVGGAIGHSPMYDDGVFYVGSMDRYLYAIRAQSGQLIWKYAFPEGVWASPVVSRGLVMVGARDGRFYAIRADDGTLAWSIATGDRILSTGSIAADGRHVLFASEDMHAYCVEIDTGHLRWRSRKMAGLSVRDYFPTIVGNLAIFTTNPVRGFHETLGAHEGRLLARVVFVGDDKRFVPATPEAVAAEQEMIVAFLRERPHEQTFYAFAVDSGEEPWIAPVLYTAGLHNPPAPPCYDPRTLDTFVLLRTAYGVWDGGGEVRSYTGLGQLDLNTGRVRLVEHSYGPREGQRAAGIADMPWGQFNLIGDETQALSVSPHTLFSNHQGYLSGLERETWRCRKWWGDRDTYGGFYGPGNFGWGEEGRSKARDAGEPYGIINEWHGPARAIVSVAGRYVYFAVGSQVLCLQGE